MMAVHPSGTMIIGIVLYKNRFDVCVTNAGDNTIRIVLNRRDVSGRDRQASTYSDEENREPSSYISSFPVSSHITI
jgi:hypothetical protein